MTRRFCVVHGLGGEVCDFRRHRFGVKFFPGFGLSRHPAVQRASLASAVRSRYIARQVQVCKRCGAGLRQTLNQCRHYPATAGLVLLLSTGLVFEQSGNIGNMNSKVSPVLQNGETLQKLRTAFPTDIEVKNWAAVTLARPLFTPGRSPFAVQAAIAPTPLPRLAGILITSGEKIGIFSGTKGGSIIVKAGDHLGVFTVLSIAADNVHISGPAGIVRLQIQYETNRVVAITPEVTADNAADFPGTNSWPSQLKITQ